MRLLLPVQLLCLSALGEGKAPWRVVPWARVSSLLAGTLAGCLVAPHPGLALYSDELALSFDTDYLGDCSQGSSAQLTAERNRARRRAV